MWGSRHLLAILLSAPCLGCLASVDVMVDEGADLAAYRTWNWAPVSHPRIDAPNADTAALEARISRLIEANLRSNGFVHSAERGDFSVTYQLAVRHRSVVVNQPNAIYQLDSMTSDGSFVIESSQLVTRVYTEVQLAVGVRERRGRTVWQAAFSRYVEDGFGWTLDDAVAAVLETFPRRRPDAGRSDGLPRPPRCPGAGEVRHPEPDASDRGAASSAPWETPDLRPCPEDERGPESPRPAPQQDSPPVESVA